MKVCHFTEKGRLNECVLGEMVPSKTMKEGII